MGENVLSGRKKVLAPGQSPLGLLEEKQLAFVKFVSEGKPVLTASRLAGYSKSKNYHEKLLQMPHIRAAIVHLQKRYENSIVISRQKVLEGFLDAIEQAKMMADPAVQIAGWREIGKMVGYYAPEVKEVNINIGAKRIVSQLEVMSDAELLELIEKDKEAIEGAAHRVLEAGDEASQVLEEASQVLEEASDVQESLN